METLTPIIKQAIKESQASGMLPELVRVLQELESKTAMDIANAEYDQSVQVVFGKVHSLLNRHGLQFALHEPAKIHFVAQVFATIQYYLYIAVADTDIKPLFIALILCNHAQVDSAELVIYLEYETGKVEALAAQIKLALATVKFNIQALPGAPFHELAYVEEYAKGIETGSVKKVYSMVEALERGGRGFHLNYLLEHAVVFLSKISLEYYFEAFRRLELPADFVFYFQSVEQSVLLAIAAKPTFLNKWGLQELIRQIIKNEDKTNVGEKIKTGLYECLKKVKDTDHAFLLQVIAYYHRSINVNAALGHLLAELDESDMREIINDSLPIDKYSHNLNARDFLWDYFKIYASDEVQALFLTLIFEKWKKFLDGIIHSDDAYQNEILFTDYADIISWYFGNKISADGLLALMRDLIHDIKFIDAEWFPTSSLQITAFHLYHSRLLLITEAYKLKSLDEPELVEKYVLLTQNAIQISRYVSSGTLSAFERGRDNLK